MELSELELLEIEENQLSDRIYNLNTSLQAVYQKKQTLKRIMLLSELEGTEWTLHSNRDFDGFWLQNLDWATDRQRRYFDTYHVSFEIDGILISANDGEFSISPLDTSLKTLFEFTKKYKIKIHFGNIETRLNKAKQNYIAACSLLEEISNEK